VLPDEERVREEVLRRRSSHLAAELQRLADVVQMSVRLVPDEQRLLADVMASSSGLRSLEAEVRRLPPAAAQGQQLRLGEAVAGGYRDWVSRLAAAAAERLAEHARDVRLEPLTSPEGDRQAAFLVTRTGLSEFLRAGGEVAEGMQGRMVVRITGPLPPFSFLAVEDGAGEPVAARR
jgi:hypothetical protein